MKLSTQEEYGLRCLLQLARQAEGGSLTIPQISQAERLSAPNVAKILRILRRGGLVSSERGQHGGYSLVRPAALISVLEALDVLGGRICDPGFCTQHAGNVEDCAHSLSTCSVRALWDRVQGAVDQVLRRTSLRDLAQDGGERRAHRGAGTETLLRIVPTA
jgi:Rrf2 family protein